MPDGGPADFEALNELQRAAATGEIVARWWERRGLAVSKFDAFAREVQCPALVVRRRGDQVVDLAGSKRLTALLPDAQFVELEGNNHMFLANEPEFETFLDLLVQIRRHRPGRPDQRPRPARRRASARFSSLTLSPPRHFSHNSRTRRCARSCATTTPFSKLLSPSTAAAWSRPLGDAFMAEFAVPAQRRGGHRRPARSPRQVRRLRRPHPPPHRHQRGRTD